MRTTEQTAKLVSFEEIVAVITASVEFKAVKKEKQWHDGRGWVPSGTFFWSAEVTVHGEPQVEEDYFLVVEASAKTKKALSEALAESIAKVADYVDQHQPQPTRYGGSYKIPADYPLHGTEADRAEFNRLMAKFAKK